MEIMDVQSAFDVVHHNILLDNLLDKQIHPIMWTLIKDMYSGLKTRVKWLGELSESFPLLQGGDREKYCKLILTKYLWWTCY